MARVYVIDDDPELLSVVALALEEAGHAVDLFRDSRKAISFLRQQPPDVLVLDILMPGMDGIETIRAARSLQPKLPIIAISGGGLANPTYYLKLAQTFGATATLAKPFRMAELVAVVAAVTHDVAEND